MALYLIVTRKIHLKKNQCQKMLLTLKDNFSFDKMVEKLDSFLPTVEAAPQTQQLQLPKLKKTTEKVNNELSKLKLPKLKKC